MLLSWTSGRLEKFCMTSAGHRAVSRAEPGLEAARWRSSCPHCAGEDTGQATYPTANPCLQEQHRAPWQVVCGKGPGATESRLKRDGWVLGVRGERAVTEDQEAGGTRAMGRATSRVVSQAKQH